MSVLNNIAFGAPDGPHDGERWQRSTTAALQ